MVSSQGVSNYRPRGCDVILSVTRACYRLMGCDAIVQGGVIMSPQGVILSSQGV